MLQRAIFAENRRPQIVDPFSFGTLAF